jgi:hypothetical protein
LQHFGRNPIQKRSFTIVGTGKAPVTTLTSHVSHAEDPDWFGLVVRAMPKQNFLVVFDFEITITIGYI